MTQMFNAISEDFPEVVRDGVHFELSYKFRIFQIKCLWCSQFSRAMKIEADIVENI